MVQFNSSLWASMNTVFCNYQITFILLDWSPFCNWVVGCFVFGRVFLYDLVNPIYLINKS